MVKTKYFHNTREEKLKGNNKHAYTHTNTFYKRRVWCQSQRWEKNVSAGALFELQITSSNLQVLIFKNI